MDSDFILSLSLHAPNNTQTPLEITSLAWLALEEALILQQQNN